MSLNANEEMLAGYADPDATYPDPDATYLNTCCTDTDAVYVSELCLCAVGVTRLRMV